jgi:hypothetical protein
MVSIPVIKGGCERGRWEEEAERWMMLREFCVGSLGKIASLMRLEGDEQFTTTTMTSFCSNCLFYDITGICSGWEDFVFCEVRLWVKWRM